MESLLVCLEKRKMSLLRQISKASLTSGSLYILGDIINQKLFLKKESLDTKQSLRFGIVGATLHGPYFLFGFKFLDRIFGTGRVLKTVLAKSLTGQMIVFPPFVVCMLSYNALLQGKSDVFKSIKNSFLPIFLNGFYCWPVANIITFRFVPVDKRIVWINSVGIIWNTYLAWEISNSTKRLTTTTTTNTT
jgi:protein Mpv17